MSSSSSKNFLELMTSDDATLVVEKEVALQSPTIKKMVEDGGYRDKVIPLSEINSEMLGKTMEWCKKHANVDNNSEQPPTEEELQKWDDVFVKNLGQDILIPMLKAANYLDCARLKDLLIKKVRAAMKDMTVEQLRQFWSVESDFTP